MGTEQTYKKSLELAKQFIAKASEKDLKALIKKSEAFANSGPTYNEYLDSLQELDPAIKEYILCAAIWFDDGKEYRHQPKNIDTGLVLCGWRHGCIFPQIGGLVKERQQLGIYEKEQGFLTNLNRFVGRKEGAEIALKANQIKESKETLFSEDLY